MHFELFSIMILSHPLSSFFFPYFFLVAESKTFTHRALSSIPSFDGFSKDKDQNPHQLTTHQAESFTFPSRLLEIIFYYFVQLEKPLSLPTPGWPCE